MVVDLIGGNDGELCKGWHKLIVVGFRRKRLRRLTTYCRSDQFGSWTELLGEVLRPVFILLWQSIAITNESSSVFLNIPHMVMLSLSLALAVLDFNVICHFPPSLIACKMQIKGKDC